MVFRDVIGLKPGDVWYRTLEFELESSDVMVLVVSEKVRTSKWVHNEVSMAEEIAYWIPFCHRLRVGRVIVSRSGSDGYQIRWNGLLRCTIPTSRRNL